MYTGSSKEGSIQVDRERIADFGATGPACDEFGRGDTDREPVRRSVGRLRLEGIWHLQVDRPGQLAEWLGPEELG